MVERGISGNDDTPENGHVLLFAWSTRSKETAAIFCSDNLGLACRA